MELFKGRVLKPLFKFIFIPVFIFESVVIREKVSPIFHMFFLFPLSKVIVLSTVITFSLTFSQFPI
jgi:hypothetical protein